MKKRSISHFDNFWIIRLKQFFALGTFRIGKNYYLMSARNTKSDRFCFVDGFSIKRRDGTRNYNIFVTHAG